MVDLTFIHAKIAEFQRVQAELVSEIKANFEGVVRAVLEENKYPVVSITGYTPGFNDGEPCEHSLYVETTEEAVEKALNQFADGESDAEESDHFKKLATARWSDSSRAVRDIFDDLDEILHTSFGTNWQIIAAFDDEGNFHYNFDADYDCGY